jgi:ribosomal protein S11
MAEEKKKRAPKVRRREKKNVPVGHVHIAASFNNTRSELRQLHARRWSTDFDPLPSS